MPPIPDRYEAAIRLERSAQRMRDLRRAGMTITEADFEESRAARQEYDEATARIR